MTWMHRLTRLFRWDVAHRPDVDGAVAYFEEQRAAAEREAERLRRLRAQGVPPTWEADAFPPILTNPRRRPR